MDMPPPSSPQRPPGRNNKGKRPQASSSTDYKETLDTISESLQKFVDLQEQKQYNNDMKLLWTPTDHLTGRAREMAEKTNETHTLSLRLSLRKLCSALLVNGGVQMSVRFGY
ncbi:hypothetical protein R6Q59_012494 [Mikania micrantha]